METLTTVPWHYSWSRFPDYRDPCMIKCLTEPVNVQAQYFIYVHGCVQIRIFSKHRLLQYTDNQCIISLVSGLLIVHQIDSYHENAASHNTLVYFVCIVLARCTNPALPVAVGLVDPIALQNTRLYN